MRSDVVKLTKRQKKLRREAKWDRFAERAVFFGLVFLLFLIVFDLGQTVRDKQIRKELARQGVEVEWNLP